MRHTNSLAKPELLPSRKIRSYFCVRRFYSGSLSRPRFTLLKVMSLPRRSEFMSLADYCIERLYACA